MMNKFLSLFLALLFTISVVPNLNVNAINDINSTNNELSVNDTENFNHEKYFNFIMSPDLRNSEHILHGL